MTARMSAADNIPRPNGGPLKNGIDFHDAGTAPSSVRTAGTSTNMPHSPYTIDGIAASNSVRNTRAGLRRFGHNSEMNTEIPSAIGVAIARARMDEYSVPQMNGSAPKSPATGSHVVVRQKLRPNF